MFQGQIKSDDRDYGSLLSAYTVIIIMGFAVGFVGNLMGLVLSLTKKLRQLTMSIHLVFLSLLGILSIVAFCALPVTSYLIPTRNWGVIACPVILTIQNFCEITTSLVNLALTTERYISVRFPLQAKLWVTRKRVLITDSCILIVGLVLSLPEGYLTVSSK